MQKDISSFSVQKEEKKEKQRNLSDSAGRSTEKKDKVASGGSSEGGVAAHAKQLPDCLPACGATRKLFLAPSQQVHSQLRKKKIRKSHKGAKVKVWAHQFLNNTSHY